VKPPVPDPFNLAENVSWWRDGYGVVFAPDSYRDQVQSFGECWRVRGIKFSKWHVIIPGIVILLTVLERWVLSPDILIPVNGSESAQKA
jgi:hypothetical protein